MLELTERDQDILQRNIGRRENAADKPVELFGKGYERAILEILSPGCANPDLQMKLRNALFKDRKMLQVSGWGASGMLFADPSLGMAKKVILVDSDPVTVAWQRAAVLNYNRIDPSKNRRLAESIGRLLGWDYGTSDDAERQYCMALIRNWATDGSATNSDTSPLPLDVMRATLGGDILDVLRDHHGSFESVCVPFVFGEQNGIVDEPDVRRSFEEIHELCSDNATVMITSVDLIDPPKNLFIPIDPTELGGEPDGNNLLRLPYNGDAQLFRARKDRH